MAHKIKSYSERLRYRIEKEQEDKEFLKLRQAELDLFREDVIKEFIESDKDKGNFKNIVLGIFKAKKLKS